VLDQIHWNVNFFAGVAQQKAQFHCISPKGSSPTRCWPGSVIVLG
jgi:hypothetical protein